MLLMSREVKFRIWDKTSNRMLYQDDFERVELDTKNKMVSLVRSETIESSYVLDYEDGIEAEIMQYTGFKDVKGKEIYEGDILHVTKVSMCGVDKYNVAEYNTDVKWEDGAFVIKGDADVECYDTWLAAYNNPDSPQIEIEVIGNIYENPELLRSEE